MDIGNRILTALELQGMTQTELADHLGIGKSQVGKYVHGKILPKTDTLYRISSALRTSSFMFGLAPQGALCDGDLAGYLITGVRTGILTLDPSRGFHSVVFAENQEAKISCWEPRDPELMTRRLTWYWLPTEENELSAMTCTRLLGVTALPMFEADAHTLSRTKKVGDLTNRSP